MSLSLCPQVIKGWTATYCTCFSHVSPDSSRGRHIHQCLTQSAVVASGGSRWPYDREREEQSERQRTDRAEETHSSKQNMKKHYHLRLSLFFFLTDWFFFFFKKIKGGNWSVTFFSFMCWYCVTGCDLFTYQILLLLEWKLHWSKLSLNIFKTKHTFYISSIGMVETKTEVQ